VYFYLTTPNLVVIDPMFLELEESCSARYRIRPFVPGLHRVPVGAIREARGARNVVSTDSGTLLLVDGAFFVDVMTQLDWDRCVTAGGRLCHSYLAKIAHAVGNRFGVCSALGLGSGSEFEGDGDYRIDVKAVERVG
jgi:hypothetical protein